MKSKVLVSIVYLLFCLSGCYADTTASKDESDNKNLIKQGLMEIEVCSNLSFDKKILATQFRHATTCYVDLLYQSSGSEQRDELVNYLSERLLALDLPIHLLTEMLEITAALSSSNIKLIKKLINRGASTKNIPIDRIVNHNDVICEPIEIILENNEELYRTNPVFGIGNSVDASDIFPLVDTYVGHHYVCVKAIEKLISYYPESIDLNSNGIPLKHLLQNPEPTKVPPTLAVKLLSNDNVNMTDDAGDTALHTYLMGNQHRGIKSLKKYQTVIDKFIELGGDLDLKNNNGITVRELLIKNSLNTSQLTH